MRWSLNTWSPLFERNEYGVIDINQTYKFPLSLKFCLQSGCHAQMLYLSETIIANPAICHHNNDRALHQSELVAGTATRSVVLGGCVGFKRYNYFASTIPLLFMIPYMKRHARTRVLRQQQRWWHSNFHWGRWPSTVVGATWCSIDYLIAH